MFLTLMLIISNFYIPLTAIAEVDKSVTKENSLIVVSAETEIHDENHELVGYVREDSEFKANIVDGTVYIKWNSDFVTVDNENVTVIENGEKDIKFVKEEVHIENLIDVNEDVDLYDPISLESVATIKKENIIEIIGEIEGYFEVTLGERLLLLEKTVSGEAFTEQIEEESAEEELTEEELTEEELTEEELTEEELTEEELTEEELTEEELTEEELTEEELTEEELTEEELTEEELTEEEFSKGLSVATFSNTMAIASSFNKYFKADRNVAVYDNSGGTLVQVGTLRGGQVFPIISDYGNWHRISFGDGYGYVRKIDTSPDNGNSVRNENNGFNNSTAISVIPNQNISVYDNSTGSLVPFGSILKGVSYPIINEYGPNWYRVDLGGRVGFIRQSDVKTITKEFKTSDKYFEVIRNTTIYDNSTGSLVAKGTLNAGEHYPRVSDYGNWHRIQYGDEYGYIRKSDTIPSTGSSVKNQNTTFRNSDRTFNTNKNVAVYDNTSGSLVPFATINNGEAYPFVNEYGTNWYRVIVADRIGFVRSADVSVGPIKIYNTTSYNYSLNEMLDRQMRVNPQTDLYRNQNAFVSQDYISTGSGSFPKTGRVTASTLNVREQANTNSWIFGTLSNGNNVNLVGQTGNWYEIRFGAWRSAKREDVRRYIDPNNFDKNSRDYLQFLQLSRSAGTSATELNKALTGKGVLAGTGAAFKSASETHSINEIYLIAHALLETGHGQSTLAKGVRVTEVGGKAVEPKVVYNMFGIGAFDGVAERAGAEYAYNAGWDTPEKAIIGGARFIGQSYINHPTHKQDTLYKMRWNPGNPATHQYATDIGWAVKQVSLMDQLYNQMDNYTMYFDVPKYQ
ncbi:SH3 domain-containing protein [Alkalihalobacillus sp. 1P02AB]|uniref:SH3 domain-containing protein n=1 Tax=Alkalihalobacillus sp. 1P02AB TaxID=3132260 RepID=UPI0039A59DD5